MTTPAKLKGPPTAAEQPSWVSCTNCRSLVYGKRYKRLLNVCPECGTHARLDAPARIAQLFDEGSVVPLDVPETQINPLDFVDQRPYAERLTQARHKTGQQDAVLAVRGRIENRPLTAAVMDFRFFGGSLGVAAGEAVTTAAETALRDRTPLLLVTASGGARMQEGALSLMQMAKTSNALAELDEAGLLTVTLVTDPTYGGVAASFATLSDVVVAEPGARMGFAGPRVIEQTIRQKLPDGFQTAEFLRDHGLVDGVWERSELRPKLARLLAVADTPGPEWGGGESDPVVRDSQLLDQLPAWDCVQLAREAERPTTLEHIGYWLDGFVELTGDRAGEECAAIVGGIGRLDDLPVMVIGHQKGHTTAELVRRNFGMPSPAGYRKAARLMRLAAKLRLPVVTLIDTPGAYPGITAEETGQSGAIAENLRLMGSLPVPVVAVVTGEGGSGGALALGVADRVLICANATYSVISPEGCAAILWKNATEAAVAADELALDAASLLRLGVVDGVIPEPEGGGHTDTTTMSDAVRRAVVVALRELRSAPDVEGSTVSPVPARRRRFRSFGLAET
ncbi:MULTISPECIES: acetyl-CoA carboxylase, carboxyltransferase subunit beta [unclassified Streptomyces]|uniref:acetyl-CoA carboxylase, carboxyltransferase subunit beta n=1 Tax=unclassified Streptomyces TaxID=2593676 RepID=UPI002E136E44|nr:acetyl-CoA carboxylase, carboxyltransferase subunit beta [Streptomyces sp. NBC_01186]WSS40607.1 acetyl-CoA carboxylase, carboxyltransferase subunit beta [Streptomyces sp. NBC_01187]